VVVKAADRPDRIVGKVHLANIHGSSQQFVDISKAILTKIEVLE
jgi:hypothetical protein